MVYEAILVFAVLAIAASIFMLAAKLLFHHDLSIAPASNPSQWLVWALYSVYLFLVVGLYFVWFWTHQGQTLAMKTWRIRLIAQDGGAVSIRSALIRYMAAWAWFLPAVVATAVFGYVQTRNSKAIWALLATNVTVWAVTAYLDPNRQFLHDRLAGTRLVKVAA